MADLLDYRARLGSDFSRVRFHNLRCSHATQLVLAGVHPKVAQERFWHSTVTTTLDLYGHDAGGCASRLDAAFGGTIRAIGEQKRTVGRFGEYRSVATSVAAVGPKPASYQFCRVSTVAVQRFCKPKVGGSNPSPGTNCNNVWTGDIGNRTDLRHGMTTLCRGGCRIFRSRSMKPRS